MRASVGSHSLVSTHETQLWWPYTACCNSTFFSLLNGCLMQFLLSSCLWSKSVAINITFIKRTIAFMVWCKSTIAYYCKWRIQYQPSLTIHAVKANYTTASFTQPMTRSVLSGKSLFTRGCSSSTRLAVRPLTRISICITEAATWWIIGVLK